MGRVDDAMRRAEGRHDGADPAAVAVIDPEAAIPVMPLEAPDVPVGAATKASIFERLDSRLAEKVVVDDRMLPGIREQYRRLAATLHQAQALDGLRAIMIASAVEKEGKSLTSSNLALTLSESYQRKVLLIDADLRRPSLHYTFGLEQPVRVDRSAAVARRQEAAAPSGVIEPDAAAGWAPEFRSDGRAHVPAHAVGARRGDERRSTG